MDPCFLPCHFEQSGLKYATLLIWTSMLCITELLGMDGVNYQKARNELVLDPELSLAGPHDPRKSPLR
jgi:hypothetical protein